MLPSTVFKNMWQLLFENVATVSDDIQFKKIFSTLLKFCFVKTPLLAANFCRAIEKFLGFVFLIAFLESRYPWCGFQSLILNVLNSSCL